MPSRIARVFAAFALVMLVVGPVVNLKGRAYWHDASASAQEAADQVDDAAPSQDSDPAPDELDETDAKAKPKPTPVSAGGVYSGTVMDANRGAGTISAAISQIRSKISGTWQDTFVPPAFLAGTLNAKGVMSLRMRFYLKGNCGYLFSGNFRNGNEIIGNYKLSACPRSMGTDHGTLDMIKQ